LVQRPNTLFAFKRGINAARRKKEALFPKQAACSCLLPLLKNMPATAACTTLKYCRRRVTTGKTEVVEAIE
jgi:hypothetical protein